MSAYPQFYGTASVEVSAEDDGSRASIVIEVSNGGAGGQLVLNSAFACLSIESAAQLAEQIDAAIDLLARTDRAREEARIARIAALKATLAGLGKE